MSWNGGVVTFDYAAWQAGYPEFSTTVTSQGQAQGYFVQATFHLGNGPNSPVLDASPGGQRATLLNMLVAHIAMLSVGSNGAPASPLVGRIDQATQGSVTAHADMPNQPQSAAWYQQTKYGAMYWAATPALRTARYVVGPAQRPAPMPYTFGAGRY